MLYLASYSILEQKNVTEYCSSDTLSSLACNSAMQDFKLNKLYIFRKYLNSPTFWRSAAFDLM